MTCVSTGESNTFRTHNDSMIGVSMLYMLQQPMRNPPNRDRCSRICTQHDKNRETI